MPRALYTNCPRKRGRKEEGRGRKEEDSWQGLGSGLGWEGEGRKYLCSHLNVNQVWLEQGSRDRGGRSKREPNRREEVEMGVVRCCGRGAEGESESQAVLGTLGMGQGAARGLTSKATKGDRAKAGGLREDQGIGLRR